MRPAAHRRRRITSGRTAAPVPLDPPVRRLLNGSDYPLPGVMPLFSLDGLGAQRFITRSAAVVLKRVRELNLPSPAFFPHLGGRRGRG